MRKITIWLLVCALFVLCGCQGKSAVNLNAKNDNGTPAVNLPDSGAAIQKDAPADTAAPEMEDIAPVYQPADIPTDTAAPETEAPFGGVVEIKEKMFIAQTNDIYYNAGDYLGKTIKYEGIFSVYEAFETGAKYYSVIRYGPGCCGIDANAGFEVVWNETYPEQNDWVEAVGILEEYEEEGYKYLRLALSSLTVLPARGAEYVSQ
ncbi:MAG: hypothetical protein LBL15_01835 [Oscillospiraceae bacterium]|jgi:uncharacterized membrane protein YcgQ (UPF0703/DUF1980 family)|nr:hypothetical protein [Oscillospiraceae bacterium]